MLPNWIGHLSALSAERSKREKAKGRRPIWTLDDTLMISSIMKGNNGLAVRRAILQQLAIAILTTLIVVVTVKRVGKSNWHASSLRSEEHNHADDTESKAAIANLADITAAERERGKAAVVASSSSVGDKTLVKIVFGNLDGEAGKEGEVIMRLKPEWAPLGVKRIQELTETKFWDECRAFR